VRLARNLRRSGRLDEAQRTYLELASLESASVAGVPAPLVAHYARCALFESVSDVKALGREARALAAALVKHADRLTAATYALYTTDAQRWGAGVEGRGQRDEALAAGASAFWEQWRSSGTRPTAAGRDLILAQGPPLSVLWQQSGSVGRALIATPMFVEQQWLAPALAAAGGPPLAVTLRARDGSPLVETNSPRPQHASATSVRRAASDIDLPWHITVSGADPTVHAAFATRRRLLAAGLVVIVMTAGAASVVTGRALQRELAVARLQSDFVAAVSHEFRTPLTALRQFTERLREQPKLSEQDRGVCYDAQARATDRLTRLVDSLLDFGRMEAGMRPYQLEPHDCSRLVHDVVADFRRQAGASDRSLGFHGNGATPVNLDPEALSRALWNLLDNAFKYSPGEPSVEVSVGRRGDEISIAVRDAGIGIAPHEQQEIFDRFRRGAEARSRGIAGTGIGLAMVDQIVRAHGGRVEVESAPGRGSVFTVVMPIAKG
jgi:signal transduction histidine kinase